MRLTNTKIKVRDLCWGNTVHNWVGFPREVLDFKGNHACEHEKSSSVQIMAVRSAFYSARPPMTMMDSITSQGKVPDLVNWSLSWSSRARCPLQVDYHTRPACLHQTVLCQELQLSSYIPSQTATDTPGTWPKDPAPQSLRFDSLKECCHHQTCLF